MVRTRIRRAIFEKIVKSDQSRGNTASIRTKITFARPFSHSGEVLFEMKHVVWQATSHIRGPLSIWRKNVYYCPHIYFLALFDERWLLTWQQMQTAYNYTVVQISVWKTSCRHPWKFFDWYITRWSFNDDIPTRLCSLEWNETWDRQNRGGSGLGLFQSKR
jgi:hypothetical protein